MKISLSDAIDDLLTRATQDPGRLNKLAAFCIEEFARHGLEGVRGGQADEVGIRGFGRQKDWDLAFVLADKPRLLVSLKSILKISRERFPTGWTISWGKPRTSNNCSLKS